jgi:hypothetical protein
MLHLEATNSLAEATRNKISFFLSGIPDASSCILSPFAKPEDSILLSNTWIRPLDDVVTLPGDWDSARGGA